VARRAPGAISLAGLLSHAGLLALVGHARLLVCGDTGVAHVASATGTPSVVLFGPTAPSRWGPPVSPRHRVLWSGTRGDPHGAAPDPGLLAIDVDAVLVMVAEQLRLSEATVRAAERIAP
jgi:ADP-heptose:LPS heptosyltransferase